MLNILMYALGSGGDIDPMVVLGKELKRRGHKVTLLSNEHFKHSTLESGLDFFSVGTEQEYQKGNTVDAWQADNYADNFQYYYTPAFEPSFNYVMGLQKQEKTVLVTLDEKSGAAVAALRSGIPVVRIILSPNILFSAFSPPAPQCWTISKKIPGFIVRMLLRLNRKHSFKRFFESPYTAEYIATRERLGCPLVFAKESSAKLQLAFFPEWYGMRPKDWPADVKCLGFHLANRPNNTLRAEVDEILSRLESPIVFTSGTPVKDVTEIFREGRKICEQLQIPGLFVGGDIGKEALAGSDLCAHMSYVDFEYLLPKVRAIVHHGGVGTTAQAIQAGIPQFIRPIKYDQPDNANRISKLGLGAYVMLEHFKAELVAPMISDLLGKAKNSQALRDYSADVKSSNAIVHAGDLIEQLCRTVG